MHLQPLIQRQWIAWSVAKEWQEHRDPRHTEKSAGRLSALDTQHGLDVLFFWGILIANEQHAAAILLESWDITRETSLHPHQYD